MSRDDGTYTLNVKFDFGNEPCLRAEKKDENIKTE